jgi:hypothetical protein
MNIAESVNMPNSGPFSSVRRGEGWDEESGGLRVFTEGVKMPLPGNDELATFMNA